MLLPPLCHLSALDRGRPRTPWRHARRSRPGAARSADRSGRLTLASLSLMVVVVVAGASLATTVPVGVVMLALAMFARLGRGDRSTLLALPLVFGVRLVVVPSVIKVWSALHGD